MRFVLLTAAALLVAACEVAGAEQPCRPLAGGSNDVLDDSVRAAFRVRGMACEACAARLRDGLRRIHGVTEVDLRFQTGRLIVRYDPSRLDIAAIVREGRRLGFELRAERA